MAVEKRIREKERERGGGEGKPPILAGIQMIPRENFGAREIGEIFRGMPALNFSHL